MSKKISLNHGLVTIVDDSDYEWLVQWEWSTLKNKRVWYAVRSMGSGKRQYRIYMHREILGLSRTDPRKGDHIDGDGLNNRRKNLRVATVKQNSANRRLGSNNTSGYVGLIWQKRWGGWWEVYVKTNGKRNYVGRYKNKEVAARERDKAATILLGEYAYLNFPKGRIK